MTLPVIGHQTYEVKLTSRGVTKFRPFMVREQKILMMAVQGKDLGETVKAIRQVIKACVLDDIDVDDLPMVDLEMLFLHLRARSMGELMEVYYKCEHEVDGKECGMPMEIGVNLLDVKVKEDTNLSNRVEMGEGISVEMHYPSFDLINLMTKYGKSNVDAEFIVVAGCVDKIYTKDEVFKASEANPEELQQFVMELPIDKYEKLKEYILSAPKVKQDIKHTCPKCKFEHSFSLEGLNDFFT